MYSLKNHVEFCIKQIHRMHAQCMDSIIARSLPPGVHNIFHELIIYLDYADSFLKL
jgi:hypothetical protein